MSEQQAFASESEARLRGRPEWPRDPYKGLNYFSAADAPLFGQRESEIDDMVRLVCSFDTKAILLHGGTGTGKSSFLRAGLCQRLGQLPAEDGREFFFLSEALLGGSDDPLLIRATDDPVGVVYDVLRKAAENSPLSEQVRQALREILAQDIPHNRLEAIPAIIDALRAITAPPQRATLVLLVDQAEEVLTLPRTADAENRRLAFFALIEQICFCREMDLRLIIALRTEYYGRFCSFFRIAPTTKLTPKTAIGSGLFDYLLLPLSIPDIAAAIRQPTLDTPRDDGLPPARSVYGFSYQESLPDTIAADLKQEASALPSMQIVCKQLYERVVLRGKRSEITEQDYRRFGRAQGAIDAFMVRAIQDAADSAKLPRGDSDVDRWSLVLNQVVGRAEGGTVQTLIASRQDLVAEASKQGIAEAAADAMFKEMADPERRLLRVAGGEGGRPAYSLGHDSIGPSVMRRAAQAAVRGEEETKQAEALAAERTANETRLAKQREDQRVRDVRSNMVLAAVSGFCLLLFGTVVAISLASRVWLVQQKVETLTSYALHDGSSDFRLKLLLAASALRLSDTEIGHWFVDAGVPRNAIRDILLRSPVFGGVYDAGTWDVDGKHAVRLQNNKIVIRDIGTGKESQSDLPEVGAGAPTSVGLTQLEGTATVGAFRIPTAQPILGQEGSNLIPSSVEMPKELDTNKGIFISRADIFGTHFRIILMNFVASAINKMWVIPLLGNPASVVKLGDPANQNDDLSLDWKPVERSALRQPVLAEDCDLFTFLGRNESVGEGEQKREADHFKVWFGKFTDQHAQFAPIKGNLKLGSIAVERGCRSLVVRDDNSNLHIIPLDKGLKPSKPLSASLAGFPEGQQILVPTSGQAQPMLAASRLKAGTWRVAWPTVNGMTLVNVEGSDTHLDATLVGQMLTGIEPNYVWGSLGLSPDGSFAFLSTQQNFFAPTQLRAFDLNLDRRRKDLESVTDRNKLVDEACRVAKFQTGSNFLSANEREIWLGSRDAPQPCTGTE